MTPEAKGYRFFHLGGAKFRWFHRLESPEGALDCTDMTDDEFDEYATPYAGPATGQEQDSPR